MPTITECPSCERKVRIPDQLLGATVKCPTCGAQFRATTSAPGGVSSAAEDVSPRPSSRRPAEEPGGALRPCPQCAELIRPEAVRCRHCGADLDQPDLRNDEEGDERPWERPGAPVRRDCEPHRGGLLLTLGILSIVSAVPGLGTTPCSCCFPLGIAGIVLGIIGVALGITSVVLGQMDLKRMHAGVMDPSGRGLTLGGMICGIVGGVLSVIAMMCDVIGLMGWLANWVH
jgi:hypothetical protein